MTELSFLIDLLLNHKLSKPTQKAIQMRITEVESNRPAPIPRVQPMLHQGQAPSMQAKIEAMENDRLLNPPPQAIGSPIQATSMTAAQALQDRQKIINQALSGKEEPGRSSPRKY